MSRSVSLPATDTETHAPRSFAPRRGLPNGRAVVGALLVSVAAIGTFALATTDHGDPDTRYVVMLDDIEPGDAIGLDDLALEPLLLSPAAASNALRTTSGLEGATALTLLRAGSILDPRDVNGAAFVDGIAVSGVHELTIPVSRERAPSALRRGDRVAILAYSGGDETLHTAIEDALVLGFEIDAAGIGASADARLTLALDGAEAVTAVTRWSYQPLTVVLTTRAVDDEYPIQLSPPTTVTLQPGEVAP
ncbi:MAG: hypothetical protein R2707_02375 [Acidimicrobiales bacterium]